MNTNHIISSTFTYTTKEAGYYIILKILCK